MEEQARKIIDCHKWGVMDNSTYYEESCRKGLTLLRDDLIGDSHNASRNLDSKSDSNKVSDGSRTRHQEPG